MATLEYIGARYVPMFYRNSDNTSEWRSGVEYEALTIVTWNSNSYTSRIPVPASVGAPSENPEYWVNTGAYNAQITQLQNDVNQLKEDTAGLGADPLNVLSLGVKNDGSEDCSLIINQATEDHNLYFPDGIYRFDSPLILKNSICGSDVAGRRFESGAILSFNIESGSCIIINEAAQMKHYSIANIMIMGGERPVTGIDFIPSIRTDLNLDHVSVHGTKFGLNIAPTVRYPQAVEANSFATYGLNNADLQQDMRESIGIYINANAVDCSFSDIRIFYHHVGFQNMSGGHMLTTVFIYPQNGSVSQEEMETYYGGTCCVNSYDDLIVDTAYLDTAYQLAVQRGGLGSYGNVFSWYDGTASGTSLSDGHMFSTRDTGKLYVASYICGGNPATQSEIAVGNTEIANFKTKFPYNPNKKLLQMPMGFYYKKNSYSMTYTPTGPYFEVARIAAISWGMVTIRTTFENTYTDLQIIFSGAGAVNRVTAVGGYTGRNYYYKVVDGYCVIYLYNASYTNINISNYLLAIGGPKGNGLVSPADCEYAIQAQADATGLTAVTVP